ncbi:FUSC family protein [Pandoraea sp. XJJ-1]|uniref:FUSC family protein n=1 Tax=Pandoraea sp. XJJ-1 TaxID=3002643 RepID=UPI00227F7DF0|nr:FUSC family protein [Pandoraea sp. XJJ-1]WAL83899.1 FUSC family protein [Pandoraea sp. XJJ-1]
MALPAGDLRRPGFDDLLNWLAPFPGRAATATRVAIICVLTTLVATAYGTPEAALSAYVVFFLIRPDRVTSIVTSVAMLVLVSIVIGFVLLVATLVLDNPMARVASIAGLSAVLLFITSASKLRPVGAIIAMIVGFALDKLGSVPLGEVATRALLYAWLMVAIPMGATVCVQLAIGPSPRKLAGNELARRLRIAARMLRDPDAPRDALDDCLSAGDEQIGKWLKLSVLEGSSARADAAALRQATSATFAILVAADLVGREPAARLSATFTEPLASSLERMARMLEAGGYPVDIAPADLALPPSDVLAPLARVAVGHLSDAIKDFTTVVAPAATPEAMPSTRSQFFLPDAFSNPDHIRYALKTTVAAMFCYLLYSLLDWPGIHTCFITVYIVSLGTTAETVEKLTLRIAGCIVGALAGTAMIVFVMPGLSTIAGLLSVVAIGAWLSAWIAFGSPRIGYAGFQVAFAFFLCVVQGPAPAFDLTIARDRTIGILLGNVVVCLIFTRVWPVSVAGRVDAALVELRQRWQALTAMSSPRLRRAQAASAIARRGALQNDVAWTHYEPSWVSPSQDWTMAHRRMLAELEVLEGPMTLLSERHTADTGIGDWLKRLDLNVDRPASIATRHTTAAAPKSPASSPADQERLSLLMLGDARLIQLDPTAHEDDAAKEHVPHASA